MAALHSDRIRPDLTDTTNIATPGTPSGLGRVTWFSAKLSEEDHCLLTGVTCLNGNVIVTDNENKLVKRFSPDGYFMDCLSLQDPCGICNVPKSQEVIVTEPDKHQLTFCSVGAEMDITSVCTTQKKYECVAALDALKLVAGCCQLGLACVDVIDYNGSVLRSIQKKDDVKLFRNPAAITCLNSGEILVSDAGRCALICISPEGETEFTYDPSGRPSGICVDTEGGIYMAQYDFHSVFRLSHDGVKESVIVDQAFQIKFPLALAVMETTLVLTEEMPSDRVLLIQIPRRPVADRQLTNLSLSNVRVWLHQSPRSTTLTDIPDESQDD